MFKIEAIEQLVDALMLFPGIGPKNARRMAEWVVDADPEEVATIILNVRNAFENVKYCSVCHGYSDQDVCKLCLDPARKQTGVIMVVEHPQDVMYIEDSGAFKGNYHVLGGSIDPMEGITVEDLNIADLAERLSSNGVIKEVIIATGKDTPGRLTQSYLAKFINQMGVKATTLATGIPAGCTIEDLDDATIQASIDDRMDAKS